MTRRMIAAAAACGVLLGSGVAVAASDDVMPLRAEQQRPQQNDRAKQNKAAQQNKPEQNSRAQENDRAQQNDRGAQQSNRAKQNERAQQNDAARGNADKDRGKSADVAVRAPGRGRLTDADVQARMRELPENVRRFESSNRQSDRMTVNAIARGVA